MLIFQYLQKRHKYNKSFRLSIYLVYNIFTFYSNKIMHKQNRHIQFTSKVSAIVKFLCLTHRATMTYNLILVDNI